MENFAKGREPGGVANDWYLSLFSHKPGNIAGDITPAYSGLSDKTVAEAVRLLPDAPVILLLRHPVERIKSALSMSARRGRISPEVIYSPERLEKTISSKSFPSRIWGRWVKHFGSARCHYFFIDDIRSQPGVVRDKIAGIGGLKHPEFHLDAGFNRKSKDKRLDFPAKTKRVLYAFFEEQIQRCKEVFKGSALNWKEQP